MHKKNIVACLIVPRADGQHIKETRTFKTLTSDLEGLVIWLRACRVTHVLMENTAVYWKPVFNRQQKVLEDANLKLATVTSDVMGVSGRAILEELVRSATDPQTLAELLKGRLGDKQALLVKALQSRIRSHHRFMLAQYLSHIHFLDEAIEHLDNQIEEQMYPFEASLQCWDSLCPASISGLPRSWWRL